MPAVFAHPKSLLWEINRLRIRIPFASALYAVILSLIVYASMDINTFNTAHTVCLAWMDDGSKYLERRNLNPDQPYLNRYQRPVHGADAVLEVREKLCGRLDFIWDFGGRGLYIYIVCRAKITSASRVAWKCRWTVSVEQFHVTPTRIALMPVIIYMNWRSCLKLEWR